MSLSNQTTNFVFIDLFYQYLLKNKRKNLIVNDGLLGNPPEIRCGPFPEVFTNSYLIVFNFSESNISKKISSGFPDNPLLTDHMVLFS